MPHSIASSFSSQLDPAELNRYRADTERFLEIAAQAGVRIPRGSSRDWERLLQHSLPLQRAIINYFNVFRSVCEDNLKEGFPVSDDRKLLWRMLHALGLRPVSNLFEHIERGDVVEIYDRNLVQVFRNLTFFSVSSYAFEQLMHYPFQELFWRPDAVQGPLLTEIQSVLAGTSEPIVWSAAKEHTVVELLSEKRFTARAQQKLFSPLYDSSGVVAGILATLRIQELRPSVHPHPEVHLETPAQHSATL